MKAIVSVRDHRIEKNCKVVTVKINGEVVDYRKADKCSYFPVGDIVREYREAGYEVEVEIAE